MIARFKVPVGVGGLIEREGPIDHRLEAAPRDIGPDRSDEFVGDRTWHSAP